MPHLYETTIANRLNLSGRFVANTLQLIDEGATVPFMARYRKEATGGLDEVQIAAIRDLAVALQALDKRREAILNSIAEQGKLTPELRRQLTSASSLAELEDLYLPYKQKRKTRAMLAIERGLEPLADRIFSLRDPNPEQTARRHLSAAGAGQAPLTIADALQGARDIIAERISDNADARQRIRLLFEREAIVRSVVKKGKETEGQKYKDYFDFAEPLRKVPSHRLLALRRGEAEGILNVGIAPDEAAALERLDRQFLGLNYAAATVASQDQMSLAIKDSYKRLLRPALETEFAALSKEKADQEAIRIFAGNLRQLLLSSPLGQKRVMAIDPGYRTGCKTVCLDAQGHLQTHTVLNLFASEGEKQRAAQTVHALVKQYKIEAIAIGNGTAGRETEAFIQSLSLGIPTLMVSEQGASIYSASEVARQEFPDKDVTVRGAVSIGRRLMDPLAELVKIDPKSIGVGQYQHDVDQNDLKKSLDDVVESCVNQVGVSLNTASASLLQYVSGLGPQLAKNVVDYRAQHGAFASREQLKKVPRLGPKAYEQAAGFLRISSPSNPLDNSAVHPERYELVAKIAADLGCTVADLMQQPHLRQQIKPERYVSASVGLPTLTDILAELAKPGRDPRETLTVFEYDKRVQTITDLHEGMVLSGVVTNITAFGAFVDVGVKQDGLVHVSQMADRYISDPNQVVRVQQTVQVKVLEVDTNRKRIALTMKIG
ncbi:RNA-binding transcriptional accessory protein [Fibrella sp. HMF5335]|uniref:RNA-binding transcriptional accessory protein n=1 Tax=Fibrella rubiginis TaxID=2817060 RepID=A0A939K2W4_9BACT|nr:Tex family protein [Fibrella rubiginis]MBO0938617.1 RNA-binding transcriptional accessory protein [Fibrella rubiginis]